MASDLAQGVRWCEATLGVTPGPGGTHPLMGTHNRLLSIASPAFPMAYLEIIAIDPSAQEPGRCRWFDMDNKELRSLIKDKGPRLIHYVIAVDELDQASSFLQSLDIDRGTKLRASRPTPNGLMQWQITVREDGQRLYQGCLPTLINWESSHPTKSMPSSGVVLDSLAISHEQHSLLREALHGIGMDRLAVESGSPSITAKFHTPRGMLTIQS